MPIWNSTSYTCNLEPMTLPDTPMCDIAETADEVGD